MNTGRIIAALGVVLGSVIIAGGLAAEFAGRTPAKARRPPAVAAPATTTTTLPPGGWRQVVPATTVPSDTPVQQQYDRGFEVGFSSPGNKAMMSRAETLQLSNPAVGGGWPALASSATPEQWATEFVEGLLDVDFARQSRQGLGGWLVAEEAPDLMPGIPPSFQDRALYVSVMEPAITGEKSPIPSAPTWAADASAGERWAVSNIEVQPDPAWQQMIDAGWQPADMRAAVEDVSGLLTTTRGRASTARRFSMVLQVGSARWDDGYGSVLVSGWKELR